MWQATFLCKKCDSEHIVTCDEADQPRTFAYICPSTNKRAGVRFHDPSRVLAGWTQVNEPPNGAVPVREASARSAFEV